MYALFSLLLILSTSTGHSDAKPAFYVTKQSCETAIAAVQGYTQQDIEEGSTSDNASAARMAHRQCLKSCNSKDRKNNIWEVGQLTELIKQCFPGQKYLCGNKADCRSAVRNFQSDCKFDSSGQLPRFCRENRQEQARSCLERCSVERNNNCTPEDKYDFSLAKDLCSAPAGRPLISDSQAAEIIQQRTNEMITSGTIRPTDDTAYRSIFFGTPIKQADAAAATAEPAVADNVDRSNGGNISDSNDQNDTGGANPITTSGGGGSSITGGSIASASATGSSFSGSSFSNTSGSSSSFSDDTGDTKRSGSTGEVVGSNGGSAGSSGTYDDAPAARRYGSSSSGGEGGGSSSGGGLSPSSLGSGGGGGNSPQGAMLATAKTREGGAIGDSQFQTQFHKAPAGGKGGNAAKLGTNASLRLGKKSKKPVDGGSLDIHKLLGKFHKSARRSPAQAGFNKEIGRSQNDVFQMIIHVYDKMKLNENGDLAH